MPRQSKDTVAVLGIDIGKNTFHLVGLNKRGAIVLRSPTTRGRADRRYEDPGGHLRLLEYLSKLT